MFFNPSGIAVIGASADPRKGGNMILMNIINSRGKEKLYPVNPKGGDILGMKAYRSILDVPEDQLDLVILFIPSKFVIKTLEECVEKNVKGVIIQSAGFAETGAEGKKIQAEMVNISENSGMRIWGGNCMAYIMDGLVTTFLPIDVVPKGRLSIVGQSGYFSGAVYEYLVTNRGLGIRKTCSIGNKTDVDECDLLWHLGEEDDETGVIAFYLESFKDGRKFVKLASKVTLRKPVICLAGAMSQKGRIAASSHTGALVTDTPVRLYNDVMKTAGVILVESFVELYDLSEAFSRLPLPKGRKIAIVTITGAGGVIACDLAERHGLDVVDLPLDARERLVKIYPDWMPPRNPVDAWPAFEKTGLNKALEEMMDTVMVEGGVDAVIVQMGAIKVASTFDATIPGKYVQKYGKPVITCIIGEKELTEKWQETVRDTGAVNYESIETCVKVLAKMAWYNEYKQDHS